MNWFERLTGFPETTGDDVRSKLHVDGQTMTSAVNGWEARVGTLTTPTLAELREEGRRKLATGLVERGSTTVREVVGDVRTIHADPANTGSLIQAASQFNLLEMVSPEVTPEAGVGIYDNDPTQGPACARACGAGTIYRNWFAPVGGQIGQDRHRQIDCLATMGAHLGNHDRSLWVMSNGYALASKPGLKSISSIIAEPSRRAAAAELLRIGIQADTEVTIAAERTPGQPDYLPGHRLTQVYGSALPVAYSKVDSATWEPFARLVLEASYEATLWAAVVNRSRTGNPKVYLTLLGGGVFGNATSWIVDAMTRAIDVHRNHGLDIAIVSYGAANPALQPLLNAP